MENVQKYALKTFGIELKKVGLNLDEEIELFKIRNFKQKIVKQDFCDKSGKSWKIDLEFSEQCLSHGRN